MSKAFIFSAEDWGKNAVPVPDEQLTQREGRKAQEGISLGVARNIMEKSEKGRFFGPAEIEKVFGVTTTEIPPIPFSQEELERAEVLGQQLVLYVDKTQYGSPLTIANLNKMMTGKTSQGEKLLYGTKTDDTGQPLSELKDDNDWYKEKIFIEQTPVVGWRLTGKTELTDGIDPQLESKSKNYLEQTEVIVKYLKEKVFGGVSMPQKLQEAIEEFEREKANIAGVIDTDWQKAAEMLEKLTITSLTRETPVGVIYRLILTERETQEKLLPINYVWTGTRSSGGVFVCVGRAGAGGVNVRRDGPDDRDGFLGASFSRSV